ncbi:hypothetical protein WM42_2169 [Corynebacterium simulans]|uniref:hypothetical protein n=1 Tax=Corynebacterium TaxID=1716 RepID=UPI0007806EE9|nr:MULTISPECIES: hypothetical protein [Corynebacterium]AMO89868.1 hypothetical protein WM42_2169 [Corynebacterium simulans]OFQ45596.1 hypothetical protein HMPREF2935_05480 [Corynebacterium sp. HMSC076D02]
MAIRLYPFGFVLTDAPLSLENFETMGFTESKVLDKLFLYAQNDEPVAVKGDSERGIVWLGHATNAQNSLNSEHIIVDAFSALSKGIGEFEQFLDFVVGRWACCVAMDGQYFVYNDTLASQPVYVHKESFLIGSHLPLISKEIDARGYPTAELTQLGQHKLWDETEDPRVCAIPPNFKYDFTENKIVRFYPHSETKIGDSSATEVLEQATLLAGNSIRYWQSRPEKKYCALTAGMDTRLCAAAALSVTKDLTFVTYGSTSAPSADDATTARSYKQDVQMANRIATALEVPNVVLPIEEAGNHRLSQAERDTLSQNYIGKHALNFQGLYENILGKQPSVCYVGSGMEIFKDYFVSIAKPMSSKEIFKRLVGSIAGFSEQKRGHTLAPEEAMEFWNKYDFNRVRDSGLPIANCLFWELRAGRFQSEAINCQSTAFLPINPLAIRKVFEAAQDMNFYDRKNNLFARKFIATVYPPIAAFDVNGKPFFQSAFDLTPNVSVCERHPHSSSTNVREQNLPDVIQLEEPELESGFEVFFQGDFKNTKGSLQFTLENSYDIGREANALELFVRVNDKVLGASYLGNGNAPWTVTIRGLQCGDTVDAGIRPTRSVGKAWSNVSKTRLISWKEYEAKAETDLDISSTNPLHLP